MATRTIIDGGKQAITFNNDTEPVAVYVDGELQQNVSFVPQLAQGTGSAQYTSEYKKNIISLEVSGTTSQSGTPTPEAPIPIENANNEGMSVTLHGENLYDISKVNGANKKSTTTPDFAGNTGYGTQTDGVLHLAYGTYDNFTIWTGSKIPIKQSGYYYISFDLYFGANIAQNAKRIYVQLWNFTKQMSSNYINVFSTESAETEAWLHLNVGRFNIPDTWVGDDVYLQLQSHGTADQWSKIPAYAKNIMITYGEFKPYQPYFREEIAIPTSVEVEGATVDLNMASISIVHSNGNTYTATDYLTVDRLSNKVLYHQNVGKMTLTSTNVVWSYEPTYKYFIFSTNIGSKRIHNPIVANKYIGFAYIGMMASKDYGITTDAQWWGVNNRISIRDIRFDNVADFKADLDQNPLVIEYGLAEEITHDLTNTDLGQSLLALATGKGTNYLEIKSNEKAPQVPIKINYAKWGELVENNNNT